MSLRSKSSDGANIVEFGQLQQTLPSRNRSGWDSNKRGGNRQTATLLSIRRHLIHKACVGVVADVVNDAVVDDDQEIIQICHSTRTTNELMQRLRSMLYREFGNLRVHRHRDTFVVSHHSVENMISGLLRVQFYSNQTANSEDYAADAGDNLGSCGFTLCWGVGNSLIEAENERLRSLARKRR